MAELVVRVQWDKGFTDVSDGGTGRRRTIPYNAGSDVKTVAAAIAVGEAVLETLGPSTSVDVGVGDTSFWPEIGDAVDTEGFSGTETQRIRGRRIGIDRNGFAEPGFTLGSPSQELAERQALAIKRLSSGSTGGRSAGVAPSNIVGSGVPSGPLRPVKIPPWSLTGVREWDGPLWPADQATVATKAHVLVTAAATDDDIAVKIYVAAVLATTITLPQGDTEISVLGSLLVMPGQNLQCTVDSIGSNDEDDMVDTKLTVVFTAAPAQLRVQQQP